MDTGKSAIRSKLLSAAAAIDLQASTVEQAELAAAQTLTAEALFGSSQSELQSIEGKLYAPLFPKFAVLEVGNINSTCNYHPPKIVDGFLAFGGAQGTSFSGSTTFTFVVGSVTGKKRVYQSSIATALVKLQHAATCYDPENQIVYHPTQDGYFGHANTLLGATGVEDRVEITGQVVAAAYHPGFKKSFVASGNTAVWSGDSILTAHVAATMPGTAGVNYSTASGHIACTDTAVLAFAHQRGHATKGIQRSTDGAAFENIAGIPGTATGAAIYGSEFYDGRLWVAMAGALYSTDDNGDTWRTDIDAAANVRRMGFDSASGTVIAWGPAGVWHVVDGTATQVSGTDISFTGSFYAEGHRCIYSEATVLSDSGTILLDYDDFQIDPFVNQFSKTFDIVGAVIPHGEDRIWQLAAETNSQAYAGVVEQAYGIYVPPRGGAEIHIEAIGSGGTINVGTAINGLDTCVSNLIVAAGGANSAVAPEDSGSPNRGKQPVMLTGGHGAMSFRFEGGAGLTHGGKEYGGGETVVVFTNQQQPTAFNYFTGLNHTHRGGWPGAIATWQGFVTDPVPMLPAQGVFDSQSYEKSGPGAVIVREY